MLQTSTCTYICTYVYALVVVVYAVERCDQMWSEKREDAEREGGVVEREREREREREGGGGEQRVGE